MFEVIRFGKEQCNDKFGSLCEGMRHLPSRTHHLELNKISDLETNIFDGENWSSFFLF